MYSLRLVASDIAGNKTENRIRGIRLVRKYEKASIRATAQAFSPGSRGGNSTLVLKPGASSKEGLVGWKISIMDANKKQVKRFTGNKTLPQDIIWDGKGNNGNYLKDGFYKLSLKLQYESGNHPSSLEQFVEVDRTPAVVKINPSYMEFSPNGDGRRDELLLKHTVTGHSRDRITMRIIDMTGTEYLRKEFRKETFPKVFRWKGLGKDGKPLPEGLYTYSVETVDKVGNRSRSEVKKIRLKTGLEKVTVRCGVSAISPGNKKAVSSAVFRAGVSGKTIKDIREYVLRVTTKSGRTVRTFRSSKFLPVVKWDGRDDKGRSFPMASTTTSFL